MIAPMKKYSFLVYHKEYNDFLLKIRELGVVHIIEKEGVVTEEIRLQYLNADQIDKAVRLLESRGISAEVTAETKPAEEVFTEFNEIQLGLASLSQQMAALRKEMAEAQPWGDFLPSEIEQLQQKGIKVKLFSCPQKAWNPEWAEKNYVFQVGVAAGVVYFAAFDPDGTLAEIDADEHKIPAHSAAELISKRGKLEDEVVNLNTRLDEIAKYHIPSLKNYRQHLIQNAELDKALVTTSSEAEDYLKVLEGWIPAETSDVLDKFLDQEGVVYLKESPVPGDRVPILLKNKGFSSKFEMLGELYSLPGYSELDLTPFFAPFYTIFFGFCLGDAGYGILITLAAIFARFKVAKELKSIASLVIYLGISTIVFGLISGTAFGINLYETGLPGYSQLQELFKANNTDINSILFVLALLLGGIQILFGMGVKAANETIQFGFKYALGTIGWIILLAGLSAIFGLSTYAGISMETLKPAMYAILAIGGVLVLFFNSPGKNLFLNFGVGLWNTYNMVTGVLGDLLSYIRLFALGISSAILGFVFNSLALSVGTSFFGIIAMVVILVIGHSINIFMASLGSFVHPMRLTFVEFYKNAGFSGGGKKYQPFRKLT